MSQGYRSKDAGYQSILCAVDFSPPSSAALQMAADIARRAGGHLTALCVEDPLIDSGAAAAGYNTTLLRTSTLKQLEQLVKRVTRPIGLPSDAWSVETLIGKPAPVIMTFARRIDSDLIVMGTNGRRGPAKLFLGSVTETVLRRTPAPVLVVAKSRPGRAALKLYARPVLGALDLGPNDRTDARRMARAAAVLGGGSLTLLHVIRRVPDLLGAPPALDPYHYRHLVAARKRLERLAEEVGARSRVDLGIPEDEIAAIAKEIKAGVIVLALCRGRGLFGRRQGTMTYRILCASPTPVLALPPTAGR
jgi:nucleotide-binding universal stress UspA family protein